MAQEILVQPKEVWDLYLTCKDSLRETVRELANNAEYGILIYLTENNWREPCIVVEADDIEIYSEVIRNKNNATATCTRIFDDYLTDRVIEIISDMEDTSADYIQEREEELTDATQDFIYAVLGGCGAIEFYEDVVEDCKEHFLEYLARRHNIAIHRPMFLVDDDGEEFYEEYPYDCMEFEDKDNPIYKRA